jgi:hypothetical protein
MTKGKVKKMSKESRLVNNTMKSLTPKKSGLKTTKR